MKTYAALIAAAALWTVTSPAHALTLASSFLVADGDSAAACYIRNVGTTAIALEVNIFLFDGSVFTPSVENCNAAPLAPGKTCVVLVNNTFGFSLACAAKAVGLVKNLRGTLEIRDTENDLKVLLAEDLR